MPKSTYEHLRIQRAKQHVPRRKTSGFSGGGIKRDDLSRHGQRLSEGLKDVAITRNDYPWGRALTEEEEPYAVVVTVTDRENYRAKLYTQVQSILRAHIQGRARMLR